MKRKSFAPLLAAFGLLALAFAVFPLIISAQSKKDERRARQLREQAGVMFRQRNYRSAIDKYAESIVLTPDNADGHFWKGYAHYNLKEYDQALLDINAALQKGFDKPAALYTVRADINYELKNYDDALADMNKVLQAEPRNGMFQSRVGEIYEAKGEYQAALEAFQKAAAVMPASGDIYYHIAVIQSKLGNPSEQLIAANQALAKHTQYLGETYLMIGEAYQRNNKLAEASDAYERALSAKPDNIQAYRNLADIYRSQNRFNEAIATTRRALRLFPQDGQLYTDISWYYSLADRNEEAIQAAQAGIRYLPKEHLAYTNLCRAYNETKQYSLAVNACNSALQLAPNDGETSYYLGRAYDLSGKTDDATRQYKKAVEGLARYTAEYPTNSDGFYLLGNAYFADGQRDKAIEAYRKCLELSPRFTKARYNLGIIYVLKKNKPEAEEQYASLQSLDPGLAQKLKTEIDKL